MFKLAWGQQRYAPTHEAGDPVCCRLLESLGRNVKAWGNEMGWVAMRKLRWSCDSPIAARRKLPNFAHTCRDGCIVSENLFLPTKARVFWYKVLVLFLYNPSFRCHTKGFWAEFAVLRGLPFIMQIRLFFLFRVVMRKPFALLPIALHGCIFSGGCIFCGVVAFFINDHATP